MTIDEVASAIAADIVGENLSSRVDSVSTDSRSIAPGQLFFCLHGEHFNGHDYAAQAAAKGASAIVADSALPGQIKCPLLKVPDTLSALGRLAGYWRERSTAKVVGVTGTAGKTTVKELLASILAKAGRTAKSFKNFNNSIGLPMCILQTDGRENFWVMEAGISKPGDMDALGYVLQPDLVLITNVGPGHLSGLGDVAGVARNKCRLLDYLKPDGQALVNMDCPALLGEALMHVPDLQAFSIHNDQAPYFASYLGTARETHAGGRFLLKIRDIKMELTLARRGAFWAENYIAAAAAADMLGLPAEEIKAGLEQAVYPEQRFSCRQLGDWFVVDDSYNANPLSMKAVLSALPEMTDDRPLVCVLGEMKELGAAAAQLHQELGSALSAAGCSAVFWRGNFGAEVRQTMRRNHWDGIWQEFDDQESFRAAWQSLNLRSGIVLVKGSRSNRLDEAVKIIEETRHAI